MSLKKCIEFEQNHKIKKPCLVSSPKSKDPITFTACSGAMAHLESSTQLDILAGILLKGLLSKRKVASKCK